MATAVTRYDQVVVNVPHIELKKFKAVVKALGFTFVQKTELEKAIEDVENGKVVKCNSLEELINRVG